MAAPAVNSVYMLAGPCAHRLSRLLSYIDENITLSLEAALMKKSLC